MRPPEPPPWPSQQPARRAQPAHLVEAQHRVAQLLPPQAQRLARRQGHLLLPALLLCPSQLLPLPLLLQPVSLQLLLGRPGLCQLRGVLLPELLHQGVAPRLPLLLHLGVHGALHHLHQLH
jgi:hypothetical protein